MIYQFVVATLHNCADTPVNDILKSHDIKLRYDPIMNHGPTDGRLLISPYSKKIFLKSNLPPPREQFVILHELGHYFLEYENGILHLGRTELGGRMEWQADLFAALYLLKNKEPGLSIIDYLQLNGCPENTACRVYDYLDDLATCEISS
ncbi:ImmA/IrrE family metallo-endopeptidase [Holdemania sp. 1001302B_160321_E10]|uniref:ImmA/IrrE family metallo-endopeptidase n=1 Tax=Holdemania sp. 1001302B_160321_E10 TaxID=2787120 RepID=UPI00189A1D36|nr:ImmA/IrrE family metallo-endopeptidase [Holdemania sp. 1001302B_160321_E10]